MGTPLRVLIIEDSAFDADLILRSLIIGGLSPAWRRVDTKAEVERAFSGETWDLVLCDYHLPSLEAREVLEAMHARDLDLPFIVISGVASDEDAATMMNAGAHDYVPKTSLKRLSPIVNRELREARMRAERRQALADVERSNLELEKRVADRTEGLLQANKRLREEITERKRAEAALLATQEELHAVTQTMTAGVARCSSDLRFRWVNPAFASLLGCPVEAIAGRNIAEVLGSERFSRLHPYIEQVLTGAQAAFEEYVVAGEGEPNWYHEVFTPTFDEVGVPDGWVAVVSDITERKRSEEALRIAHDELEMKVRERTADLLRTNEQLQAEITERQALEQALRTTAEQLEQERAELVKKNITLQEIFEHVKEEKAQTWKQVRDNIDLVILPALVRLKDVLGPSVAHLVDSIERDIQNITSPQLISLRFTHSNLSPREVDVCRLIRNGLSTKEIANVLGISPVTVQKHREVIRKKLGLTNEETSLQSFLLNLGEKQ